MRWPVFFAVVVPATLLGAIVGGLRERYRPVEGADFQPPPGYVRAVTLGDLRVGQTTGTGNATVLAIWFQRGHNGGVWIARMNEQKASYIGHGQLFLQAFEQGMRTSAEKHNRELAIKSGETRDIAGRQFACVEATLPDTYRRIAVTSVGRSELLLNADAPIATPDLHAAAYEAMREQVARLAPPEAPRAVRSLAAGKGAGIGFGAALAPAIGLASILRRRR